jgi:hypothetical protein
MRYLVIFGLTIAMMIGCLSVNAQTNKNAKSAVSKKVEVYYFHFTRRCNTCISVENNAKKAFEQLYADKVKSGEYSFKALNLDEAGSKTMAEKFSIGGQTLLVVCGNKRIDITDKGFMNAQNFDKMKEEIKKAVDQALKD